MIVEMAPLGGERDAIRVEQTHALAAWLADAGVDDAVRPQGAQAGTQRLAGGVIIRIEDGIGSDPGAGGRADWRRRRGRFRGTARSSLAAARWLP